MCIDFKKLPQEKEIISLSENFFKIIVFYQTTSKDTLVSFYFLIFSKKFLLSIDIRNSKELIENFEELSEILIEYIKNFSLFLNSIIEFLENNSDTNVNNNNTSLFDP